MLPTLFYRRNIASLSLHYFYYYDRCSDALHFLLPPAMTFIARTRYTMFTVTNHSHSLRVLSEKGYHHSESFFSRAVTLCTSHFLFSLPYNNLYIEWLLSIVVGEPKTFCLILWDLFACWMPDRSHSSQWRLASFKSLPVLSVLFVLPYPFRVPLSRTVIPSDIYCVLAWNRLSSVGVDLRAHS